MNRFASSLVILISLLYAGFQTHGYIATVLNSKQMPYTWNLDQPAASVSTNIINRTSKAVRYHLASDAFTTANAAAELNALRSSFEQWESIPGTRIKFEDAGLVPPGVDINTSDKTNVVFWAKNSTLVAGGTIDIRGTLAVAFPTIQNDQIVECDIVLNGSFTWYTDFNIKESAGRFIEATMAHEVGHFIGLEHSPVGGATLLAVGGTGVSTQAGLSMDEVLAARNLYPATGFSEGLGGISGQVKRSNVGILGAIVTLEDPAGNVVTSTATRNNGTYTINLLTPGEYQIRATPLDPLSNAAGLMYGFELSNSNLRNAVTDFLPTENQAVTVQANTTTRVDINVMAGEPAFRIARIRPPTTLSAVRSVVNRGTKVAAGTQGIWVGVYGRGLPISTGQVSVTGDGITHGSNLKDFGATSVSGVSVNLLSVQIDIDPNATPGLRSLVFRDASGLAWANGFLEIEGPVPDYDFDGLDDRFQRAYFERFSAKEADPDQDADQDTFDNHAEFISGTNPINNNSFLEIESVSLNASGAFIKWKTVPGKKFRVWTRENLEGAPWQILSNTVVSTTNEGAYLDLSAQGQFKLYRIEALP